MKTEVDRKSLWLATYDHDEAGYGELLEADAFRNWDRNTRPEGRAEDQLIYGLRISYAKGLHFPRAIEFFKRAILVAERALTENHFRETERAGSYPRNRAAAVRTAGYSHALLGDPLDRNALLEASGDYQEWCEGYGKGDWDSQAQANYLAAVRLALVAADLTRASGLLEAKKSFKWHKDEHALWKRLVECRGEVRNDQTFVMDLEWYFDKIRDPSWKHDVFMERDILRLELAAIRDKYVVSEDGQIDWARAVDSVAA